MEKIKEKLREILEKIGIAIREALVFALVCWVFYSFWSDITATSPYDGCDCISWHMEDVQLDRGGRTATFEVCDDYDCSNKHVTN